MKHWPQLCDRKRLSQQLPIYPSRRAQDPLDSPACQTRTPALPVPPFLGIPFVGTPPVGCPFAWFIASPRQKKWQCSSCSNLGDQCNKWTYVNSQEVKVRSECSSAQDNEDTPELVPEARPSSKPQGQEPTSPPSSPNKAPTHPDDGNVVGTSRSTRDQDSESNSNHSLASSNSDASRGNVVDSDM